MSYGLSQGNSSEHLSPQLPAHWLPARARQRRRWYLDLSVLCLSRSLRLRFRNDLDDFARQPIYQKNLIFHF